VRGRIPEDKPAMIEGIDEALEWSLEQFRPPTEQMIGLGL
jgi:hypothetical protein